MSLGKIWCYFFGHSMNYEVWFPMKPYLRDLWKVVGIN